jgi:hypothetical protein
VPVEMLRVLILTEVCDHPARSMFIHDLSSDFSNNPDQFEQEVVVLFSESEQRSDMTFRNHYNMHRVERARMVEGKHIIRFKDLLNRREPTQNFVAVKIIRHHKIAILHFKFSRRAWAINYRGQAAARWHAKVVRSPSID